MEEIQQEVVKEMAQAQLEFGVEMLLIVKVCILLDSYSVPSYLVSFLFCSTLFQNYWAILLDS